MSGSGRQGTKIRILAAQDFEAFVEAVSAAFGDHPDPAETELDRTLFEPDRALGAFDGGRIVGAAAAYSLAMTVPGGQQVPVAGVTAVGVMPTHRRRGLLTALMRRQLEDVRERGEPFAALYASEGAIYPRFGYGLASMAASVEIDRARASFRTDAVVAEGRMRLVDREALVDHAAPVYERIVHGRPGLLSRRPAWWAHLTTDLERHREGFSPLFYAVHEGDQGVDGWLWYRFKHDWDGGIPRGTVRVEELLGVDAAVEAALWRFAFGVDLAARITAWSIPIDDPLFLLLAEPRALGARVRDGLWVRVLDAATALSARRYAVDGRLVLEVHDPTGIGTGGVFELEGGRDGAECRPSPSAPDLRLSIGDLGSALLGGIGFGALTRAGLVEELAAGTAARADTMFGWPVAPWCAEMF